MERSLFKKNQALDLKSMSTSTDIPTLSEWQRLARQAPQGSDSEWLHCSDCIYGRGGALFIGLHNRQSETSINLIFQQLKITKNKAVVGGKNFRRIKSLSGQPQRLRRHLH